MSEAQGRVGRWLRNKWHLDSLIAIGGMAAVYASTHRNGARAAIKMLHSQYTRNEQARRRFLAEGYAANKVGHRNAVLVLDDDTTEDGEVYLVMELLDGESLEGRLERVGVMSPMEVLELTDQLLEVLACAHPKGILHRDIKPANIYLTRDGSVKLLDFGLARVRELSAEAMDQSDGIVFGTVSYIAPEQARADNQHLDARSDMWSIAATMFRALTGETVHPSTGPIIDRLLAVARKPPRSIATVMPRLPRPVIELVDRALAFDPEDRWPSANVMRVVVQDVMAQLREEAEEQAEEEIQTAVNVQRRITTERDLPAVRPGGPGAVRPSLTDSQSTRPKTDPVALSLRPRNLPASAPEERRGDETDLDVDALRERPEEARQRRSRTLLTREGRAELRRILDARRAAQGGGAVEEPPRAEPSRAEPPRTGSIGPADSGTGDIDVDFDDSIIEVTIDHTGHGRHGPIAEPIADPVTPAPVRVEPLPPSGSVASDRSVASAPTSAEATPQPVASDRSDAPAASRTTGSFASVDAPMSEPMEERRPAGATRSSPMPSARSREDSERRAAAAQAQPVSEDRRARTASASYPTLGGPSSRPFSPTTPPPTRPEANSGGPAPVSGEIVDSAPIRPAEVTRAGPAAISGEIGAPATGEITRVGPPPAPQRSEPARPGAGLHDTIRPKTIPPVAPRKTPPARPTPVSEPARLASPAESGLPPTRPGLHARALVEATRAAQAEAVRAATATPEPRATEAAKAEARRAGTAEQTRPTGLPPGRGERPGARPPGRATAEPAPPRAAEAPRPAVGEGVPAAAEPARPAATEPARPAAAEPARPAAPEPARPAAPDAPATASADVTPKFLPRAGLFMAPSGRASGPEPTRGAPVGPLPQRGTPGPTGAPEAPRGPSQFRPDTLLPRRATPVEPAVSEPVAQPTADPTAVGAASPDTTSRASSKPAPAASEARPVAVPGASKPPGEPGPAATSRPASEPGPAATSRPASEPRPAAASKPAAAPASEARPVVSKAASTPASEARPIVAGKPAAGDATRASASRPTASEPVRPADPSRSAPRPTEPVRPTGAAASRPGATEPAKPAAASRPGAPETAKPAMASRPGATESTTSRPAEPARPVSAGKPGASEPAKPTPTTRPGAADPTQRTAASKSMASEPAPVTEPAAAPVAEPAKPVEPATPTAPQRKSMFNPYPSLAGGRPGDDGTRPRANERSGPKDSRVGQPRSGEPSGPKDSKVGEPATSPEPRPVAAPDPKASAPAEPTPEPVAAPITRPKPGAAPVLPFSFLRAGPTAPRTSEPAPERPPGEPADPTRKKP